MSEDLDLLNVECGSVTAPAGCGKTTSIADALKRHVRPKPVLILTHTNAGVSALRRRLKEKTVGPQAYRLSTIDGWALKLISTFPARSKLDPAILLADKPKYDRIQKLADGLLASGNISDVLRASYDRLIVDEYQDCTVDQH